MTILEMLRELADELPGQFTPGKHKLWTCTVLLEAGFEPADDYEESLAEYNKKMDAAGW